jgi:hypothetical protein
MMLTIRQSAVICVALIVLAIGIGAILVERLPR